jgi:ABC-type antimicrobial peptide transport system permease subunit
LRKAVGARPADLKVHIALEVLAVAVAASAVGMGLAWSIVAVAAPRLEEGFGIAGLTVSPGTLLAGVAAALGGALVGGLLPAFRAARLDPIEALS